MNVIDTPPLIDNASKKQFEMQIDDQVARIEYIRAQNNIYLTHTEVPAALSGRGVGSTIVKAALEQIKKEDLTLIPLCPFVALYIKRHPEWRSLVLKGINIE